MTLKDLLARYSFAEIRQPFMRLWQTNEPKSAARLDLGKWERIYRKVQALEPVPSDYYIGLVSRWEHCSPMIDMNCSVYERPTAGATVPWPAIHRGGKPSAWR